MVIFYLFFAFIVCFIAVMSVIALQDHFRMTNVVDQLARHHSGSVAGSGNRKTAYFKVGGHSYKTSFRKKNSVRVMEVSVQWAMPGFRMKIFAELITPKLKKFLKMQDIIVGEPKFDSTYIVQSDNTAELLQLLTPEAQQKILVLGQDLELAIVGGKLKLTFPLHRFGTDLTKDVVDKFVEIHLAMLGGMLGAGQFDMKVTSNEVATCMVCGESVTTNKVTCRSCNTPHHRDCWQYLGQCSTYACGQRNFRDEQGFRRIKID